MNYVIFNLATLQCFVCYYASKSLVKVFLFSCQMTAQDPKQPSLVTPSPG